MSNRKITIHIGTYKTATSSLQHSLARSGAVLADAGVKYASTGLNETLSKHLQIFDRIIDSPYNRTRHERQRTVDYLSGLVDEVREPGVEHLLISEEEFSYPTPEIAQYFAPLRDQADVQVVMVVRPQTELLESLYLQFMKEPKRQITAPFEEYLEERETIERGLFDRILEPWSEAFGHEAIRVMDFRDLVAEGAITGFARRLGLPTDLVEPPAHLNRSITPAAGELIRRVAAERPEFPRMRMAGLLQELEQDRKTTLVTKDLRKSIERRFRRSNKQLNARYGVDLTSGSRSRRRPVDQASLDHAVLQLSTQAFVALWDRNLDARKRIGKLSRGRDDAALTEALDDIKSALPW